MAKLALINRNEKRKKLVAKYAKKREFLNAIIADPKASDEARYEARLKLQGLPRNSNKTRLRNRCALTGRPRGVYSKFGLAGGWEMSQSPYARGYNDVSSIHLGQNILWYSITR